MAVGKYQYGEQGSESGCWCWLWMPTAGNVGPVPEVCVLTDKKKKKGSARMKPSKILVIVLSPYCVCIFLGLKSLSDGWRSFPSAAFRAFMFPEAAGAHRTLRNAFCRVINEPLYANSHRSINIHLGSLIPTLLPSDSGLILRPQTHWEWSPVCSRLHKHLLTHFTDTQEDVCCHQRRTVTKRIRTSSGFKYKFSVVVLYLSIYSICCLTLTFLGKRGIFDSSITIKGWRLWQWGHDVSIIHNRLQVWEFCWEWHTFSPFLSSHL